MADYMEVHGTAPRVTPRIRSFSIARRWWWQYIALTYKNSALFVRRWGSAAVFLLSPAIFVILLWLLRDGVLDSGAAAGTASPLSFGRCRTYNVYWEEGHTPCTTLGYAPQGGHYDVVMRKVAEKAGLRMGEDVVGFASAFDLLGAVGRNPSERMINSAITFDTNITLDLPVSSPALQYTVYYNGSRKDSDEFSASGFFYSLPPVPSEYFALQAHLEAAILEVLGGGSVDVAQSEARFRSLVTSGGSNGAVVGIAGPALLTCGATVSVLVVYHLVAQEKQQRQLQTMKMMGLLEGAYWSSWAVPVLLASGAASLLAMGIARASNILLFTLTDYSVHVVALWLFLVSYSSAVMFLGSFTFKPRTVNILSFVVFAMAGLTGFICSSFNFYDKVYSPSANFFAKGLVLFWPFFHYGRVLHTILGKTQWVGPNTNPQHFHWADLSASTNSYAAQGITAGWDAPSAGYSLWMMLLNAAVYFALAWYAGQLAANGEASSLAPWFPLDPVYWGLAKRRVAYVQGDTVAELRSESAQDLSVRAHMLTKSFGTTTAVKEVSATLPNGQLVALLGQNGAGKTTLVNVLSGVLAPTNGEAFVLGYSVRSDIQDIQSMMGSCPQDDTLWDYLTCEEHLHLYSRFKCIPEEEIRAHVLKQLELVQLEASAAARANTLSGGMQRRLSVAVSLVGDPQIVLLDEPTTGLDPLSRRRIWDMIAKIKQDRVCVLTTHSMEEADALGDLIAIMAAGRMRAFGTPLFLKNQFGSGYQVNLLSHPDMVPRLESMVADMLPGAEVVGMNAGNMTVGMPNQALKRLPAFFQRLESERGLVREWGISHTTLEEVFLRLVQQNQLNQGGIGQHTVTSSAGMLCTLCRHRVPEQVVVATASGSVLSMPHVVCMPCALGFPAPGASGAPDTAAGQLRGLDSEVHAAIVRTANDKVATGSMLLSPDAVALLIGDGAEHSVASSVQEVATLAGQLQGSRKQAEARARVLVYARAQAIQLARSFDDANDLGQLNGQPLALSEEGRKELAQAQARAQQLGASVLRDHQDAISLLQRAVLEAGDGASEDEAADQDEGAMEESPGSETGAAASNGLLSAGQAGAREEAHGGSGVAGAGAAGGPEGPPPVRSEAGNVPQVAEPGTEGARHAAGGLLGPPALGHRTALAPVGAWAQTRALFLKNATLQVKQRRTNMCACCCVVSWLLVLFLVHLGKNLFSQDKLCKNGLYYEQGSGLDKCGEDGFRRFFSTLSSPDGILSWDSDQCYDYQEGIECNPNTYWQALSATSYVNIPGEVNERARVWVKEPAKGELSKLDLLGEGPGVLNSTEVLFVDRSSEGRNLDDLVWHSQHRVRDGFEDLSGTSCANFVNSYSRDKVGYLMDGGATEAARTFNEWFPDVGLQFHKLDVDSEKGDAKLDFTRWTFGDAWYEYSAVQLYGVNKLSGSCGSITASNTQPERVPMLVNALTNGLLRAFLEAGTVKAPGHTSPPLVRGMYKPYPVLEEYAAVPKDALGLQLLVLPLLGSFMVPSLLGFLSEEKQSGLFFMMRMQGLSLGAYWIGTYLYCMVVLLALDALLIGFGFLVGLTTFTHVNLGISALLFFCFSHSMVGFIALGSGLLGNSRVVSVLSYLFVFLQSLVIYLLTEVMDSSSWVSWLNAIPQLGWGRAMLLTFGRGAESFRDIRSDAVSAIVTSVAVSTVLFFVGVYLHAVVPAKHGQAKSPGFIFKPLLGLLGGQSVRDASQARWRRRPLQWRRPSSHQRSEADFDGTVGGGSGDSGGSGANGGGNGSGHGALSLPLMREGSAPRDQESDDEEALVEDEDVVQEQRRVEAQPEGEESSAIVIRGLRKVYKGSHRQPEKVAVRRLHLAMEFGECFGLLGPNGAGKTTTLSVLSGFQDSTSGGATIAGYDTATEMQLIHRVLGMCPQFDTVWSDLTVGEHLLFYARLKGAKGLEERAVVQQMAHRVQLDGDAFNMPASSLSGGMRRRLSLAIALIGNPPVLFLDEPSTGLDPETRRQIWDIVQREKDIGRAIVITTHSMEEADTLCSRIGIMSHGELRCLGSQLHLKNRFGSGYRLTLSLGSASAPVEEFVRRYVSADARLDTRMGTSATFVLPRGSVKISSLFHVMDTRKQEADIVEWGISQTSLEEVFVRIATEAEGMTETDEAAPATENAAS